MNIWKRFFSGRAQRRGSESAQAANSVPAATTPRDTGTKPLTSPPERQTTTRSGFSPIASIALQGENNVDRLKSIELSLDRDALKALEKADKDEGIRSAAKTRLLQLASNAALAAAGLSVKMTPGEAFSHFELHDHDGKWVFSGMDATNLIQIPSRLISDVNSCAGVLERFATDSIGGRFIILVDKSVDVICIHHSGVLSFKTLIPVADGAFFMQQMSERTGKKPILAYKGAHLFE